MRTNLVLARVGDQSLHHNWLEGSRNFDVALSGFGTSVPRAADQCVYVESVKGPKWKPLHDFLKANERMVRSYRYVALPDDDVDFSGPVLSELFDICREHALALAQPSLDFKSYYSHPITLHRRFLTLRYTNFVEAMIPCFRTDVLYDVLDTFSQSSSGWGLDSLWSSRVAARGERVAIVDAVRVTHTRPVGGELYRNGSLGRSPFDDLTDVLETHQATLAPRVISAVTTNGIRVPRPFVRALGLMTRFQRRADGAAKWARSASAS